MKVESQSWEREQHALQIRTKRNSSGAMRVRCPVRIGTIRCPLVAGTDVVALEDGRPVIEKPENVFSAGGLSKCCAQDTVLARPPGTFARQYQPHYWGTPQ